MFLQPGASQKVSLELDQRSVAYFNTTIHQWDGLPGTYNVLVGASSQDIRLSGSVFGKIRVYLPTIDFVNDISRTSLSGLFLGSGVLVFLARSDQLRSFTKMLPFGYA